MVKYERAALDPVFAALADGTRREVLDRLGGGPLSVSELAAGHAMSLPGFMKHLAVQEAAGLIARAKQGRVVQCELAAGPLQDAAAWIVRYQSFWTGRLDALDRYLHSQGDLACPPTPPSNPPPPNPQPSTCAATTPPRRKRSGAPGPTRRR